LIRRWFAELHRGCRTRIATNSQIKGAKPDEVAPGLALKKASIS
jgi:hypothetical protein